MGQGMNRNLALPADAAAARKVSAHVANPSRGPTPFTAESSLQRYVSVAAGVFPNCVRQKFSRRMRGARRALNAEGRNVADARGDGFANSGDRRARQCFPRT
jgi:hypothetical protein